MMSFSIKRFPGTLFSSAFAVFLALSLICTGLVFAETLYVKKSGTKLQAEGSAKSAVVKVLGQGTPVEVKEKSGKFYKVTAAGAEGYVFKFKLTSKQPAKKDAGGGLLDILGKNQQIAAKEASSGSSIRGLSPISEDHAKKKGISQESIQAVKQMEAFKVTPEEVEQFLAQRQLGEYSE
jgi:parvulin-like peptidyl-prolyl isomerase